MRIYLVYFLVVVGLIAASGARAGQTCYEEPDAHGARSELMSTALR